MPTAREAASAVALAEAARRIQVKIRNAAIADIVKLWPLLNFDRIDQAWQPWLRLVVPTLNKHHAMSSQQAALFYRASRQHALGDPGPVDLPRIAALPDEQWVARAYGYSAPGTYAKQIDLGRTPEQANRAALAQTLGTTSRITLDGGRITIADTAVADPEPVGWYRVTDGDPCAFCALMASRGAVYENKDTAGADANELFTGEGLFKFHNDCGCTVAPAFKRPMVLTGIAAEADAIYRNRGEGPALAAFRKAWDNRAR